MVSNDTPFWYQIYFIKKKIPCILCGIYSFKICAFEFVKVKLKHVLKYWILCIRNLSGQRVSITEYSEFAIPYIYRHSKDVGQDIKRSSVWSGVETESWFYWCCCPFKILFWWLMLNACARLRWLSTQQDLASSGKQVSGIYVGDFLD